MKITIMTLGSRGDVEPFVALGKGLKRARHEVALCTSVSFEKMVTRHGLTYAYVNDELLKLAGTREGRSAMEKRGNPFRLIGQVRPIIRQTLDEQWAAAQGSEAILYRPKALGGYHIAEKLRLTPGSFRAWQQWFIMAVPGLRRLAYAPASHRSSVPSLGTSRFGEPASIRSEPGPHPFPKTNSRSPIFPEPSDLR